MWDNGNATSGISVRCAQVLAFLMYTLLWASASSVVARKAAKQPVDDESISIIYLRLSEQLRVQLKKLDIHWMLHGAHCVRDWLTSKMDVVLVVSIHYHGVQKLWITFGVGEYEYYIAIHRQKCSLWKIQDVDDVSCYDRMWHSIKFPWSWKEDSMVCSDFTFDIHRCILYNSVHCYQN